MDKLEKFQQTIKNEMAVTLATALNDSVTMRLVSPVSYKGSVLIFTCANSQKYSQLKANPNCCIQAGSFYAQAKAEFFGPTMLDENKAMRNAYSAKFPGAFDEGIEFGGRNAEFILLKPTRLTGWAFENDTPTADGVPNIPFDITL